MSETSNKNYVTKSMGISERIKGRTENTLKTVKHTLITMKITHPHFHEVFESDAYKMAIEDIAAGKTSVMEFGSFDCVHQIEIEPIYKK
jgi:hypothetical protein